MSILVVVARPGEPAEIHAIDGTLKSLQELVCGGYIEALPRGAGLLEDVALQIYVNEDGKARAMAHNIDLPAPYAPDFVVGPIVVSKADADGKELGLTEKQAELIKSSIDGLRGIGPRAKRAT